VFSADVFEHPGDAFATIDAHRPMAAGTLVRPGEDTDCSQAPTNSATMSSDLLENS
jgi:hypothetical protein